MLRKITSKLLALASVIMLLSACADKQDLINELDSTKSELVFTPVIGEAVQAHGDHFHGLDNGVLGTPVVLKFDKNGKVLDNTLLKIKSGVAYKIDLKTWDQAGKEIQNDFIKDKLTADSYKAFLVGADFKLNPDSQNEQGALFQPREKKYGNGADVAGKYEVTGVLSYFILGKENQEKLPAKVTYVLRKLNEGIKEKIERTDWNKADYKTAFPGENVLELHFEVHAQ
jgi:hypothetical protein